MGSRGSSLSSGGFREYNWKTVDFIHKVKVIVPKDAAKSLNLPLMSNTPGTEYLLYSEKGVFSQLRLYGNDRNPYCDIDYGLHRNKLSLHKHVWHNGQRGQASEMSANEVKKLQRFFKKNEKLIKKLKSIYGKE